MKNLIKSEPVAFFGGLQVVLVAIFGAVRAFEVWSPTDLQVGSLAAVYVALTGFVTYLVRQSVSPVPGPLTGD